ncbi:MAG: hypothetical protein QXL72_07510 [Candidatus Caldarchaeum sp.]
MRDIYIVAMTLEEELRKLLHSSKDWQRTPVKDSPGVFVVKAPAYRGRPASLMVELNPVGPDGSPTKRKGLMLRNRKELEAFRQMLSNKKLDSLLEGLEKVNPGAGENEEHELEI